MKARLPHFERFELVVFLVGTLGLASAVAGAVSEDIPVGEAVYISGIALFPLALILLRVLDRQWGTDTSLLRVIVSGLVMSAAGLGGLVLGVVTLFDERIGIGVLLVATSPVVLILGAVNLLLGVSSVLAKRRPSQE